MNWLKGIKQKANLKSSGKENLSDGERHRNKNEFDTALFQGGQTFKYLTLRRKLLFMITKKEAIGLESLSDSPTQSYSGQLV